jgi:two-component sensor histidine kinase
LESPPVPDSEQQRLEALRELDVLDTPPEYRFDRLTRIAARAIGTRFSEINLIDEDRQWSKSLYGTREPETDRKLSFCAHAIYNDEPTVITDTLQDSRFRDHPLVKKFPSIRFYMSVPLESPDGHTIGSFCVFDPEPRSPSKEDRELLEDLAALAEDQLRKDPGEFPELTSIAAREFSEQVRELQHQVRNNMQIIMSLLRLQAGRAPTEESQAVCQATESRLQAMAVLYDALTAESGEVSVEMQTYIDLIVTHLLQSHRPPRSIDVDYEADPMRMDPERAAPVGLLVHELLSNALVHAFNGDQSGRVRLKFESHEGDTDRDFSVTVTDNGQGLPDHFDWEDTDSLGMRLIRNISRGKLNGRVECKQEDGTRFDVVVPG